VNIARDLHIVAEKIEFEASKHASASDETSFEKSGESQRNYELRDHGTLHLHPGCLVFAIGGPYCSV